MKRVGWSILALVGVAACTESPTPTESPVSPPSSEAQEIRLHRMPQRSQQPDLQPRAGPMPSAEFLGSPTITYHGGPVILAQKVAAIYWSAGTIYTGGPAAGTTGPGANDGSLVGFFLNHVGGSQYYGINTTYYNGSNTHVQNSVTYTQYWASNSGVPASGSNVSLSALQSKILAGFSSGALTWDANTVYLIFTDPGVDQDNMFGSGQACAEHWSFTWILGRVVKAAAMPYVGNVTGCHFDPADGSPNDDPAAEAVINVSAHEIEETNTDPQPLTAWYDAQGFENADKCAWLPGVTDTTANGATVNTNIGGRDFLIQQNWEIGNFQGCANNFALYTLTIPSQLPVCLNGTSPIGANTLDQINNYWSAGTVAWSSSDPGIAPVTPNGSRNATVAGSAAGTATITATMDGIADTSTATVGTCLAAPTNCTLDYIPTPHYLKVTWVNGDASASTEVDINSNGVWQTVGTDAPGVTQHFYVVGPGLYYARVRHVKSGFLPSTYCNTNSKTV